MKAGENFSNNFQIVEEAILLSDLERNSNPEVGATSVFSGTVRNIHEEKEVTSLEYECYQSLAVKEGQRILEEARARFSVIDIRCQHRVGHLQVGDVAIGVAVFSRHRRDGREACSWVVDQVKARVPIWKKEYYSTGKPEWVYCHHPHHQSSPGSREEEEFFSAQISIGSIGRSGLDQLKQTRVAVVGVGGLGTVVVENLARMGIGHITLIDDDDVSISNLARQTLFTWSDVGKPKAEVASQILRKINPWLTLKTAIQKLDKDNCDTLLDEVDLVVDATDNFLAKFLIHDHCRLKRVDLVQASVFQFEGRIHNFFFKDQLSPCFRCLYPGIPSQVCGSCADTGILTTTVTLFATLQANEVVKRILGKTNIPQGSMLVWDFEHMASQTLKWDTNPECPLCSGKWEASERTHEVSRIENGDVVITTPDIPSGLFPLQQCLEHNDYRQVDWENLIKKNQRYVLACRRGIRSSEIADYLYRRGFKSIFSLKNGVDSYLKSSPHQKIHLREPNL